MDYYCYWMACFDLWKSHIEGSGLEKDLIPGSHALSFFRESSILISPRCLDRLY